MIERPDRAMLVIPHPDDAEGGVGGTVAKWVAEGTEFVFVLCTNGDKGTSDPNMTTEKLAKIREGEQAEAAASLGVKEVIFLGYGDGELEDTREFRGELVHAIRKHKPQVVFCTDPFRQTFYMHRDHRMSGQVTLDAVFPYARDFLHYHEHIRDEGLETHKVADVLMWGTEHPDTFIDITDTIEDKINALKKHDSQLGNSGRNVDNFVKQNAQRQGQLANMTYAEGFRRIHFRG